MEKPFEKIWSNCLAIIKDIVEWQHFKTWFEPIRPVGLKDNVLTIQVPSQFFYEYIEEHYINLLAKTLKRELGKDARLEYRIMVDSGNGKSKPLTMDVSGQTFKSYSNNEMDFPLVINNQVKNPFVIPGLKKMQIDSQLNPIYTFDSFVEGDCNRVARRAGKTVAEKPGATSFNPLVVYVVSDWGKPTWRRPLAMRSSVSTATKWCCMSVPRNSSTSLLTIVGTMRSTISFISIK